MLLPGTYHKSKKNNLKCPRTTFQSRFVPAVIEGGPRRCQRQTLPKLIPLPGHLAELQEDGVQVVAGVTVVVNGWGRGGSFTVYRGTCNNEPIRVTYDTQQNY